MGDVVSLRAPIDIHSDLGRAFIIDATRAGEGVISDQELQERYELSATDLQAIAKDKAVGRAIRDERERRVRTGLAARELAAKFFVASPEILNQIQNHAESPRHRIDAVRELRATAAGGDGEGPRRKAEVFNIFINLSADGVDHTIEKTFDMPKKPVQLEMDLEGKSDVDKW